MHPDFIGIGAIKTGTTSLYHYLKQHPGIHMGRISPIRELDFFIAEKNWSKGLDWYLSHFPHGDKIQGEISGEYSRYPQFHGVPARMHAALPEARLLYLVRDPIDRIASEVTHRMYALGERIPAGTAVLPDEQILANSKYALQLSRFLDYYPIERVHILTTEELRHSPQACMREVFRFLGADERFTEVFDSQVHHESASKKEKNAIGRWLSSNLKGNSIKLWAQQYAPAWLDRIYHRVSRNNAFISKSALSDDLRRSLSEVLREDIDQFRSLTGRSFPDWNV